MKLVIFLVFVFTAGSVCIGSPKWEDLTGKKYSGSEEDLHGFSISEMQVSCNQITKRCSLTWGPQGAAKVVKGHREDLVKYTINFRVLDRKGKEIFAKSFIWDHGISSGEGYVNTDGEDFVSVSIGDLKLDYSVVEYWLSSLTWEKENKK